MRRQKPQHLPVRPTVGGLATRHGTVGAAQPDPGGDAIPAETNRAAAKAKKGPTHWKEELY